MADDDTGLTDQIIRAISEYVSERTGKPIQSPLQSVKRADFAEFTCKIPTDLHDHLPYDSRRNWPHRPGNHRDSRVRCQAE